MATRPPRLNLTVSVFARFTVRPSEGEKQKSYIVLFVGTVTRAIHLELVPDLSTFEFLMALRRFINRRPSVTRIISDNARTHVRAAKELRIIYEHIRSPEVQALLSDSKIEWNFIIEKAPQHGGWWEPLVVL